MYKQLVVIIGAVIIGAVIFWWQHSRPSKIWQEYRDPAGRFSFSFPPDWQALSQDELTNRNPDFVIGFILSQAEPSTVIGVIVKDGAVNTDTKVLESQLDGELGAKLKDFKKLDANRGTTDNLPTLTYEYHYLHASGKLTRQSQKIILSGKRAYYFVASTHDSRYSSYQSVFSRMLNSVKVSTSEF